MRKRQKQDATLKGWRYTFWRLGARSWKLETANARGESLRADFPGVAGAQQLGQIAGAALGVTS